MRYGRAAGWGAIVAALLGMGVGARADDRAGRLGEGNVMSLHTGALLTAGSAYLFGMPELIVDRELGPIELSPDGTKLLVAHFRTTPPLSITTDLVPSSSARELDIYFWDGRTRQSTLVYREPFPEGGVVSPREMYWLPDSRMALIDIWRAGSSGLLGRTLVRLDTTSPALGAHRLMDLGMRDTVNVSPTRSILYVRSLVAETGLSVLHVIPSDSSHVRDIALPELLGPLEWATDGTSVFSTYFIAKMPDGKSARRTENTLIDLTTAQISHPAQTPVAYAPKVPAALPVRLVTGPVKVSDEQHGTASVKAAWLEAANKTDGAGVGPLLLATEAEGVTLLSDESAALVRRDGGLYAIPIYKLNAEAYATALRGAQKAATISNLKQIGLAMLMYAQDYDENYPKNDGNIQQTIEPYLKNMNVFNDPSTGKNGFAFTYQGPGSMAQIENVSTTELGTLQGPGGHAVLYADGHVKWFDNPGQ